MTRSQLEAIKDAEKELIAQLGLYRQSAVRRMSAARHLYTLWDIADHPVADVQRTQLLAIVQSCFSLAKPAHRNQVVLHSREAKLLQSLLLSLEHPADQLVLMPFNDKGLWSVQVGRPSAPGCSLGAELKRILGVIWIRQRTEMTF